MRPSSWWTSRGTRRRPRRCWRRSRKNLLQQGAKKKTETIGDVPATVFEMPKKRPDNPHAEAVYVIHKDMLVVTDRRDLCQHVVARLNGARLDTLSQVPAFAATMSRCAKESGDMQPHVRWFVEPLGYAQVARAEAGGRKKRGVDLMKVLPNQGFDAVRGVGGHVFLATGDQEILHRTMVYAPPVQREAGSTNTERYNLAARMLDFPNTETLQPQPWVGRDLGTYLTLNWKMIEAFEYSKTLVNELLGRASRGRPAGGHHRQSGQGQGWAAGGLAQGPDPPLCRAGVDDHRLPPPDHAGKRTPVDSPSS